MSRERRDLAGICAGVTLLHLVGLCSLWVITRRHVGVDAVSVGAGTGLTAYMLGIRHAFDADHIAAIDNTTRKLMQQGKGALSVGFWFSVGHSAAVLALTLVLASGIGAFARQVLSGGSHLQQVAGLVGTLISSGFLYMLAALNLRALLDGMRQGPRQGGEHSSAVEVEARGIFGGLLRRATRFVSEPRQMFAIGMLFGLGFDAVTEISLLALTGLGISSDVRWYSILYIPILFGAGMSLADAADSALMVRAYGWANAHPVYRTRYNFVVTGISVVVALGIATTQLLSLLTERLGLRGLLWNWTRVADSSVTGLIIVGIFLATWIAAATLRPVVPRIRQLERSTGKTFLLKIRNS